MTNFDGVVDNRWRPDFESSRRRVREEAQDLVIQSRELSFVPARRKAFQPHDAQTTALIRRFKELELLPHGAAVSRLLSDWDWKEKMEGAVEKQRFLEPLIDAVRRDPVANEHLVIFLMLVLEPVRRGVSKAFVAAHAGLAPQQRDINWGNREEARMIRHIERERLFDVTREAALEAVFRYPSPPPPRFFLWLRETIAHRALDKLKGDLPEAETAGPLAAAQAEAIQTALAGFEQVAEPTMRDRRGLREWRALISMRDVFDVVDEFRVHDPVREACAAAVGRLPRAQREIIDGYFFNDVKVPELAAQRKVSTSTVYNQKTGAQKKLHDDPVFFSKLYSLQRVRDRVRAETLASTYPDGRLPDGRRIVIIEDAA
jgi:DNA-directed RNA polymerase specialized sigma24 family protein